MKLDHHLPLPFSRHMSVYLSRADTCVSEYLLYGSEIGAVFKHHGRHRVTKHVWSDTRGHPGRLRIFLHDSLSRVHGEALPVSVQK